MTTAQPHGTDPARHGTRAERCRSEVAAPRCAALAAGTNTGEPLPCQASFLRQPRAPAVGQRRRRKRKSQGSEVTSHTQTRWSSLSHALPRATRLNVRHRGSCRPRPNPTAPCAAGLLTPGTCPMALAGRAQPRACCSTRCTWHPVQHRAQSPCQLCQSGLRHREVALHWQSPCPCVGVPAHQDRDAAALWKTWLY